MNLPGVPELGVKALWSSVECVCAVVYGDLIVHAIQCEATIGNTVAISADNSPKIGAAAYIILQIVEPQRHVRENAISIGSDDFLDNATVSENAHLHSTRIAERVLVDVRAVVKGAEKSLF